MKHLYFTQPLKKILKQKQPICKILNPVVSVSDKYGYCDSCYYVESVLEWAAPAKKEKKK